MSKHTIELTIDGMNCGGCVSRVEKALKAASHVTDASVSLADHCAIITTDTKPDAAALVSAVEKAGYKARPADDEHHNHDAHDHSHDAHVLKVILPGLLGLPLMPLGWLGVLPMHVMQAFDPVWTVLIVLALPIMVYSGGHMYVDAARQAIRAHANMNTLIALGTLAAWIYSAVVVAMPDSVPPEARHVYLEAALIVLCLVNLGHVIERKARTKTTAAIRALLDLAPPRAIVVKDGVEKEVPAAQVLVDMVVRIRPGDRIPVDGTVTDGTSDIDEAMLTGEPLPVTRTIGDKVHAGTLNTSGSLLVTATAVGRQTVLTQMSQLVKQAQASKPPVGRMADTIAGYFALGVTGIALLTFAIWWLIGPAPQLPYAFTTALAVLVIACPCALGLATPISIMAGIGQAAQRGLLIRHADALERLGNVTTVVFDKTGTLTHGKPAVTHVATLGKWTEKTLLTLLATAEQGSEHPVGRAIVHKALEDELHLDQAKNFNSTAGGGISARVGKHTVLAGSLKYLQSHNVTTTELEKLDEHHTPLAGLVAVAVNGEAAGLVTLEDTLRTDAKDAVAALTRLGITPIMLTGDREKTASAIARSVGLTRIKADAKPEDKINFIKELQGKGEVVCMVGDGINDAPALAQADVGIAIGGGTGVAMESAPVTLASGNLGGVLEGINLSRATMLNIRQNLWGAFGYNALGIPLAAGILFPFTGWLLNPVFAGAAMALSSITVVANASRLLRARPGA
ncbi:MAG: heavy metal translocating P-type ATPase [Proteobacteria bacterium]|nr:heavy metal translocating P-type ATPase [Pseudomonadota bacterium]